MAKGQYRDPDYRKKYYQKNKEKILERTREYRLEYYEKNKQKFKDYYQDNKEHIKATTLKNIEKRKNKDKDNDDISNS